ncbi:9433_t:CDS:2 [Entrophospora sp. SA101]|nr:9433_t:CDS:2 [Entrophospora sp. SA101]
MNGSIDLTLEDEPTQRGRPRESFIWQHFSDHDLNNVSILKQILQPGNDVVGNYNEISHYLSIDTFVIC